MIDDIKKIHKANIQWEQFNRDLKNIDFVRKIKLSTYQ